MSNREDNSSLSGYYSMEKFIKELKKISGIDAENNNDNYLSNIAPLNQSVQINTNKDYFNLYNRTDLRGPKENFVMRQSNLNPREFNVNEVMKVEMTNLRKENSELKYRLNNINKRFESELNEIRSSNELKDKQLKETKDIIKKNVAVIELLGQKINNYEKQFEDLNPNNLGIDKDNDNDKDLNDNDKDLNDNSQYLKLVENNKKLREELNEKETIINNIKEELETKNEITEEINNMKNEMENYLQTMDKLYKEIETRDNVIKQLKKNSQIIQNNYQKEIEQLKENADNNNDDNAIVNIDIDEKKLDSNNKKLLLELKQSKEKELKISNELLEVQNNYNEMKINNEKMEGLLKETDTMIKTAEDSKANLKNEYESAIKELIDKYEKQIQFMKLVMIKQNEEFESKLKNSNTETSDKENKDKEDKDKDTKNDNDVDNKEEKIQMLKLLKENKELVGQNEELKNMNEMMISKLKELPNLEKKFTDLFETIKLLKEENELLKQASQYSSLLEQEENRAKSLSSQGNEDNKEIKDKDINNNNVKEDAKPTKKKNSLLDDEDDNDEKDEDENIDVNKEKDIQVKKDNDDDKKNNSADKDKPLIGNIKQKEIHFENDNSKKNSSSTDLINKDNNQMKIYNRKKLPKQNSPISPSKDQNNLNNLRNRNSSDNENLTKDKEKENANANDVESPHIDIDDEDNNENENENEDNENNQISEIFNLYKPTKDGLLAFNLASKNYYTVEPEKYEEFWNGFDPDTSIQYNTLEGLFIINSVKDNQLYYYSRKNNTFSELFKFKENHSYGCLFLDNLSKNIFAVGGKESKLVEKFSFENGTMEQLPPLSTHRYKMSCCQIDTKIYCLFGICVERPMVSLIEYLDLQKLEQKWVEVKFENQTSFKIITGMSCVTLNDNELLIIGGLINDENPNEKLLYYSIEQNELSELDKDLPDSEDKHYLFTKNNLFNLFLNGDLVSFANIDDNNQVHIIDNELKYDLYLTPKM